MFGFPRLSSIFERRRARPSPERFDERARTGKAEGERDLSDRNALICNVMKRELPAHFIDELLVRRALVRQTAAESRRAHVQLPGDLLHAGVAVAQLVHDQAPDAATGAFGVCELVEEPLRLPVEGLEQVWIRVDDGKVEEG